MLNKSGTLTTGAAAWRSIVVATCPGETLPPPPGPRSSWPHAQSRISLPRLREGRVRVLALPASPSDLGHVATIAADGLATLLPRLARFRWRELMRRSLL